MKRDSGAWDRESSRTASIWFLEFRMDPVNQCLWRRADSGGEVRVALTPKAFDVLRYLVERAGQLVTHDELLDALWPRPYVQPEVLKHQVLELRKALGDDPRHPRYIETLPRRGYRFIEPGCGLRGHGADIPPGARRPVISLRPPWTWRPARGELVQPLVRRRTA
jgi:DNA-binding winged helix-turn-helix (wHTH) protein